MEKPKPLPRSCSSNKSPTPIPLPRKLLSKLSLNSPPPANNGNNNEDFSQLPIDKKLDRKERDRLSFEQEFGLLNNKPDESSNNERSAKVGTINIFKRGRDIDPFEEFEASFSNSSLTSIKNTNSILTSISFSSPLSDLSEEDKKRLSSLSSNSSSSSSNLSNYEVPTFKLKSTVNGCNVPSLAKLSGDKVHKVDKNEKNEVEVRISRGEKPYYDNVTIVPNSCYETIDVGTRNSTPNSNHGGEETQNLLDAVEGERSKVNEYDEVAVDERGSLLFLESTNETNEGSSNSTSSSHHSITSRHSIVLEFDPLFSPSSPPPPPHNQELRRYVFRRFGVIRFPHTQERGSSEEAELDSSFRYEFIDTDSSPSPQPIESQPSFQPIENVSPPPPPHGPIRNQSPPPPHSSQLNPTYCPTYLSSSHPPVIENLYEEGGGAREEADSSNSANTPPPHSIQWSGAVGSLRRAEGSGSFLRRLSHKMRLIPIREEGGGGGGGGGGGKGSDSGEGGGICALSLISSKFSPTPLDNVVFSSYLFRPPRLPSREWGKKWAVLSRSTLSFQSEKNNVLDEIHLEGVGVVSRSKRRKCGNGEEIFLFEFGQIGGGGRGSNIVLGASSEKDRSSWMQKYIQSFTSVFPPSVTSNFDRGGWCYIKESVTTNWFPAWLILKERSLYYACAVGDLPQFYEMDLRKARSIGLSSKDGDNRCSYVENSEVLTVDLVSKILFIQTESRSITCEWDKKIGSAAKMNGENFEEMQLTLDDIPLIVDKCIDFLYANATLSEGIYRQSGSNARITSLLSEFRKDAWSVNISLKEFSVHDVAGTLKRFFRTLPQPLLTSSLYSQWIATSRISNLSKKLGEYESLLSNLPSINYNILKKLICHLYAVHELHEKNRMPINNLAPIWGPTLMNVETKRERGGEMSSGSGEYRGACEESEVVRELIENYHSLFHIQEGERERERRMKEALENFHSDSARRKASGDMKIWVYIWEKEETSALNITLTPQGRASGLVSSLCALGKLRNSENMALHEVICSKSLERPLHPSEIVIETVLRWSIWDIGERKDNYLILKKNTLYPALLPYTKDPTPVYADFKYADSKSKSFKKYAFTFSRAMLKYYKDSKSTTELGSWKIEDIVWYLGSEPKRALQTRSKEEPFFGNVVICSSEEELHKWIGAMLVGEHSAGLYPSLIP